MFNSLKVLLLLALMGFVSVVSAENSNDLANGIKNRITGIVLDKSTGDPLPGANVMIKGTTVGVAANLKGEFSLPKMPQGTYTLTVRFVGYEEKETVVELKDHSIYVEIALEVVVLEGQEVKVTAQAKGQMDAINQMVNSNKITNVVSSDRLNEIPDANAAESIGRLPGVAIQRNGGEASEVIIRGLQSGYTTVSVDGIRMASTSENRGVGITSISPSMLDGIELAKAITPDMDGDATAGAINFKIKQAPSGLKMSALLQGGFNSYDNTFGMPKIDFSVSNRFFNDKLGVFSQLSFFGANRGTDTFTAEYDELGQVNETHLTPPLQVKSVTLGKHLETRNRYGFSLVLDYKLPNGKLFFKNFSSRMTSESINMGNDYALDNLWMSPTAKASRDVKADDIVTSLAGEHKLFGGLLDWSMSYSYSIYNSPNIWELKPELRNGNMLQAVKEDGNDLRGPDDIPSYLDNTDSDIMTLRYTRHETKKTEAGEFSTKINMEIPFKFSDMVSGTVKFGGKYSRNDRSRFDTKSIVFLRKDADRINDLKSDYPYLQWSDFQSTRDYITMTTFMDESRTTRDFFGKEYSLYFPIDVELTDKFMTDVRKYSMEYLDGRKDNYDNTEQYYATYLMSEINVTNQLTFILGGRYEKTSHDYDKVFFMRLDRAAGVDEPLFEQGEYKYLTAHETRENWLPMFHIKYKPLDWMDVRFAVTKTLKRPGYLKLSPKVQLDLTKKRGYFSNPNLKVQEAINVDLYTSFYSNHIGLITVGGFYKQINNLIYYRSFTALSDEEAQAYHPDLKKFASIRTYDNVDGYNTWLKGVEFEWQTRFWYLPFPFDGLVLSLNFSYIQSESVMPIFKKTKLPGFPPKYENERLDTKTRMPGQKDYLGNMSIGYDYKGFSTRISALYQGPTYGNNRYSVKNYTTEELFRWDVKVTQEIFERMKLMFDFNNITNWPDMVTNELWGYTKKREEYGWQGSMGVRYSF